MARYLETAEELRKEVNALIDRVNNMGGELDVVKLGHIINLAVRCSPRGVQHTVRKNIVATAMADHCRVTMTEMPKSGRFDDDEGSYWRINIEAK